MRPSIELALGTAQFGMTYGIAGRGAPVPADEIRAILVRAWNSGVRTIDTAPVYGNIEARIDRLAGDYAFAIVSKIPALPPALAADGVATFVEESIRETRARLGQRLSAILFHRSDDLLGNRADEAWQAAMMATADAEVQLGVSCYSPSDAAAVRARFPIAAAQIPGNAFDQRLASATGLGDLVIWLRSVFLQGLLLLTPEQVAARIPAAAAAATAWSAWCRDHGLPPLQAALGILKALPGVRYCVVGVDRLSQLDEILEAWDLARPLHAPELACRDAHVTDPRRWRQD